MVDGEAGASAIVGGFMCLGWIRYAWGVCERRKGREGKGKRTQTRATFTNLERKGEERKGKYQDELIIQHRKRTCVMKDDYILPK